MRAKQAVWKAKEVERIRGGNQTLAKMESLLDEDLERNLNELKGMVRNGEIGNIGYEEDKAEAIREADERKALLREAFSKIAGDEYSERVSLTLRDCTPMLTRTDRPRLAHRPHHL